MPVKQMSARQFAEKYPNQIVKISAEGAREYNVKPDIIIGPVVGFRPGTNGVIGSSKVAISRGDKDYIHALDPRIDKSYSPVVDKIPDRRNGIYFLSVNHIELVEQPKPIVTYPNQCVKCGSPARISKRISICSNANCKVNRATIKALGLFQKIKIVDEKNYLLCPFCQNKSLEFGSPYGGDRNKLACRNHPYHIWTHKWKEGQKMHYKGQETYIWRNNQLSRI